MNTKHMWGAVVPAAVAAALLVVAPAAAQASFPVKLSGFSGQNLRGGPVAVPSYQIAFFTQQQGTASGGVLAKSRLTTTLTGISAETMRGLADEAYADLVAQLTAAGVPMVAEAETQAALAASGAELTPGNAEVTRIGAGVTIGAGVKKAYAAYGAQRAPMIKGLHAPGNATGFAGMGALAVQGRLGTVARSQQSILVAPSLVIDFARTDAATGRDLMGRASASVSNKLQFGLMGVSMAALSTSMNNGRASTPGMMRMTKDLTTPAPFGTLATGEGAVRALSVTSVASPYYIDQDTARGDAVIVDPAAWTALVRDAYRAFNAAVVLEIRKAQGL
ncbi:hypothetical protein [Phenylobacterium sp. SCN 70-31]|uniref:hypothetical protein n=1 Tax=Phenylobacterium sp. SCN 70-31 TaxID=1660129 RepID=UPI0025F1B154|nr:hypothetical protein [Phenylobacterium sp. SCN 70-31]